MGTTNSTPVPTNGPVLPGTNYVQTYYTDIGWSAGDYIYQYGTGSIGPNPAFTASLPGVQINMTIAQTLYTATYGTGVNPTRASYTSPTTVPSFTYNCSVTSSLGSNYTAPTTLVSSTAIAYYLPLSVTLKNGNIVTCYSPTSTNTVTYRVTTPTGTLVGSGTISSMNTTSTYRNYGLCALNAGGFAIGYSDSSNSNQLTIKTYDATGTLLSTGVPLVSGSAQTNNIFDPAMAADDGDNIYYAGRGSSPTTYKIYCILPNLTTGFTVASKTANASYNLSLLVMPNYIVFAYASTTTNFSVDVWNSSSSSTSIANYSITNTSLYCGAFLAPATNGNYFISYMGQSGSMTAAIYTRTGTSALYSTTISGFIPTSTTDISSFGGVPFSGTTSGTYDGLNPSNSFILYAGDASTAFIRSVIVNDNGSYLSTSSAAVTSIPFVFATSSYLSAAGSYSYCQTFTPSTCVTYIASATSYPTIAGAGTFTTALTGNSLPFPVKYVTTPQNGYTLLGVSIAAASAATYGSIIINGVATLSSSYGTSTTVKGFNFNPTNGYGFLGNKGYVVSRIVTLQGLE